MHKSALLALTLITLTGCQEQSSQTAPSAVVPSQQAYSQVSAEFGAKPNLASRVADLFRSGIWSAASTPWLQEAQVQTDLPTASEFGEAVRVMTAGANQDTSFLATPGSAAAGFEQASFAKVTMFFAADHAVAPVKDGSLSLLGTAASKCIPPTAITFAEGTKTYDGNDPETQSPSGGSSHPERYTKVQIAQKITQSAQAQAEAADRGADVQKCFDRIDQMMAAQRQRQLKIQTAITAATADSDVAAD